jgi:hypothetical protein
MTPHVARAERTIVKGILPLLLLQQGCWSRRHAAAAVIGVLCISRGDAAL